MKFSSIQELSKYTHWLQKAQHDMSRYKESGGAFDLANVFLTLNALPEWIAKSEEAPDSLRELAQKKISFMTGANNTFDLDVGKLDEIDHQLRLVRIFCNHAKHGKKKNEIPQITLSLKFPAEFSAKFDHLKVGGSSINASEVLESIISYWEREIGSA